MDSEIDYTKPIRLYRTVTKFWEITLNPETFQANIRTGKEDKTGQEELKSVTESKQVYPSWLEAKKDALDRIKTKAKEGFVASESGQPLDAILAHLHLSQDNNETATKVKKSLSSSKPDEPKDEGKEKKKHKDWIVELRGTSDEPHKKIQKKPLHTNKPRWVDPSQTEEEMAEVEKAYAEQQYLKAKNPGANIIELL